MTILRVHFLNVKQGDCFLIEHLSDRLTMIDICGGNLENKDIIEAQLVKFAKEVKPRGNFNMCSKPTNPIDYLAEKGFSEVWRFILTHPDMDHMDGIKELFDQKKVVNFWDCGIRREKPDFEEGSPYKEKDWDFYEDLISGRVETNVIKPRAGDEGRYWNCDDDQGNGNGDYIHIASPNDKLINQANDCGDINDASYVIVYFSDAGKIIFSGDSNNKTWEYVLDKHRDLVSDAGVLFAPHHGRNSDLDFSFLDIVKPRVSFFGCAPSGYLAYSAWQNRDLLFFTNNQCGNVHIYPLSNKSFDIYIENQTYAEAFNQKETEQIDGFWYLCNV